MTLNEDITNIEKLCIIMMVSDDHIDDKEILAISEIYKSLNLATFNEDEFFDEIIDINNEKNNLGLEKVVEKYAFKIKDKNSKVYCLKLLRQIMESDGYIRDQEVSMIQMIESIWKTKSAS